MTREEAINTVRNIYQTDKEKEALGILIPELAESEDERIRKAIVHLLEVASEAYLIDATGFKKEQFLAYLEKQKDKMTAEEYENSELFQLKLKTKYANGYQDGLVQKEQKFNFDTHWENGSMVCEQKEQKSAEWKPQPESLEALMYAIEGEWDKIKPTSYLSRRLEDLYEGLVNTYNVDESFLTKLPKTAYTAKDIEELRVLKDKIEASMESPVDKPVEQSDEVKWRIDGDYDETDKGRFVLGSVGIGYNGYYIPYSDLLKLPKEDEK